MAFKTFGELFRATLSPAELHHRERVHKVLAAWQEVYPEGDTQVTAVYLKGNRLCLRVSTPLLRHQLLLRQPLLLRQLHKALAEKGGKAEWVKGFAFP